MRSDRRELWELYDVLMRALAGDPSAAGFEVHYQPIVRLADEATVAMEALARWHHPIAGDIAPALFVPLAERAGLMGVLDDFVLHSACAEVEPLSAAFGHAIDMHVNVSASRLGRPDLEAAVTWVLDRSRLRPHQLILEITETSRITDLKVAAAAVWRLRERNVRVALDDFGAGFNALSQLHALPVDTIKLDATLTAPDSREPWRTEALCGSVLAICHGLGLTVVAEGIETPEQGRTLRQLGCRLGQGHLYGSALHLDELLPSRPRGLDARGRQHGGARDRELEAGTADPASAVRRRVPAG